MFHKYFGLIHLTVFLGLLTSTNFALQVTVSFSFKHEAHNRKNSKLELRITHLSFIFLIHASELPYIISYSFKQARWSFHFIRAGVTSRKSTRARKSPPVLLIVGIRKIRKLYYRSQNFHLSYRKMIARTVRLVVMQTPQERI